MLSVHVAMPCLGRHKQTLANVERLLLTSGASNVGFSCVLSGSDLSLESELKKKVVVFSSTKERLTYWEALSLATTSMPADLYVNLANDLLPGRDWLIRALNHYVAHLYSRGVHGVVGFNDGFTDGSVAAHFIVAHSALNRWFGSDLWPTMYDHNFGDSEIVGRAKQEGAFSFCPTAVLYHDHPVNGGLNDYVYAQGLAKWNEDQWTYNSRKRLWS